MFFQQPIGQIIWLVVDRCLCRHSYLVWKGSAFHCSVRGRAKKCIKTPPPQTDRRSKGSISSFQRQLHQLISHHEPKPGEDVFIPPLFWGQYSLNIPPPGVQSFSHQEREPPPLSKLQPKWRVEVGGAQSTHQAKTDKVGHHLSQLHKKPTTQSHLHHYFWAPAAVQAWGSFV